MVGNPQVSVEWFDVVVTCSCDMPENRKNLSESEYNNYGKQYQTFQRILAVYDIEPDNFPRYKS